MRFFKRETVLASFIVLIIGFFICFSVIGLFYIFVESLCDTYGQSRIGATCEKNNYRAKYFILVFPESRSSKNYRLVADIYRVKRDIKGYTDETGFYNPPIFKGVYVEKINFSDGGNIQFGDLEFGCHLINEGINNEQFGVYIGTCDDNNGNEVDIELTMQQPRLRP